MNKENGISLLEPQQHSHQHRYSDTNKRNSHIAPSYKPLGDHKSP